MRSVYTSILAAGCSLVLAASGFAQMTEPAPQNRQDQQQRQGQEPQVQEQPQQPLQEQQQLRDQYVQQLMKPDELTGMTVHDAQGEKIGTVDQIVLDAMNGRIGYIVVGSGGFFGMGSEESIIPWSAVQFHPSRQQQQQDQQEEPFLMVNISKDGLLAAPHGDVQDLNRRYAELIHDYYGVAPYWQDPQEQQEQAGREQEPMAPVPQQPSQPLQEPAQTQPR